MCEWVNADLCGAYALLLFVDYSSVFNTILPCRLFSKMSDLGVQHNICLWIKDFTTSTLIYSDTQHRGHTRLCAELIPLLSVYT